MHQTNFTALSVIYFTRLNHLIVIRGVRGDFSLSSLFKEENMPRNSICEESDQTLFIVMPEHVVCLNDELGEVVNIEYGERCPHNRLHLHYNSRMHLSVDLHKNSDK